MACVLKPGAAMYCGLTLALLIGCGAVVRADDLSRQPNTVKAPWQRKLQGNDLARATALTALVAVLENQDQYGAGMILAASLLELRSRIQGKDHWETVNVAMTIRVMRDTALLEPQQRQEIRKQAVAHRQALAQLRAGRYTEAEPGLRMWTSLCHDVFGDDHPATATSRNDLALVLHYLGKHEQGESLSKQAVEIIQVSHGKKHPDTGRAYNTLGMNTEGLGKLREAQKYFEKSLEIIKWNFGENNEEAVACINNLGVNLHYQSKYTEARPILEHAKNLSRKIFGARHQAFGLALNNIGLNLHAMGQFSEAVQHYEQAVAIYRESGAGNHSNVFKAYNNIGGSLVQMGRYGEALRYYSLALAGYGANHDSQADAIDLRANMGVCLMAQGRFAEAEVILREAVDQSQQRFGRQHPSAVAATTNLTLCLIDQKRYRDAELLLRPLIESLLKLDTDNHMLATAYNNLAGSLIGQDLYADAESALRTAATIETKIFRPDHPVHGYTAANLAHSLSGQGKNADAEHAYRAALSVSRRTSGEGSLATIDCRIGLALHLLAQGRAADAQVVALPAARGYEASRLYAANRGLDRALFGSKHSPYACLTVINARLGRPDEAWTAAEADLARGWLDELMARRPAKLPLNEQGRIERVQGRMRQLRPRIMELVSGRDISPDEVRELDELRRERDRLDGELVELSAAAAGREVSTLAEVSAALGPDEALIVWCDLGTRDGAVQEHWGCAVRSAGGPVWERLPGTGPKREWVEDDKVRAFRLQRAITEGAPTDEIRTLARQVYDQRLAPLAPHLKGIKHLYIVPTRAMARLPVEAVTNEYRISYVPSGTFLARLKAAPKPSTKGLLAVGDPAFPPGPPLKEPAPLPPGGLLVTQVIPGGNAAAARIQPGDVLLAYASVDLKTVDQLRQLTLQHEATKAVRVKLWREGESKTAIRDIGPGKLGVVLAREPAPQVISERRKRDQFLTAFDRVDSKELPGTAAEVARLGVLFGNKATVLVRSAASESALDTMRAEGRLKQFRYLHFATHGEPNNVRAFESALILARTGRPAETPGGQVKYFDGRLTASEVLETWELDSELVTLSACETALGPSGGGDGLLGFAQAFLTVGSRAVCLTLWKVDDAATVLLMDRFYSNLLGDTTELNGRPLGKAAALAESKEWLQNLTSDEALRLTADLTSGVPRGKGEPALKLVVPPLPPGAIDRKGYKPFAHPRYWAGFILIGDSK